MPDRFILDPSMLFHSPTLTTIRQTTRPGMRHELVVPGSLLTRVKERAWDDIFAFFAPPADRANVDDVLRFIRAYGESIEPFESKRGDAPFYRSLIRATDSERIARILFEEWRFMSTESWLFARVRQCLDKMIEAGAAGLALSRRTAERLVRRTLGLSPRAKVSIKKTLRAAAKWVALGGPTVLQLIHPIPGAITAGVAGFFLYYDP